MSRASRCPGWTCAAQAGGYGYGHGHGHGYGHVKIYTPSYGYGHHNYGYVKTYEPSYYEIALTNRQVLVAFVILLGCVVAAFFTGVWIGREGRILPDTTPSQVAQSEPKSGEPKMEEFEFFSDSPAVKQPAVLGR